MRIIIFTLIFYAFSTQKAVTQPGFCGAGYSTFSSANIFFPNSLNPTLDGQTLPFGSYIIAVFQHNGAWECAGFIQWNGNAASMVVNGSDSNLPGYAANESYKFIVQLPNGCLVDSVTVAYNVSGIYTNPGYFQDGALSQLSNFQAFSRAWITLDADDGLCGNNTALIKANVSTLGAPHTFLWSNGDTTGVITNLADGLYTVTVTTAFSCTATTQDTVINVPEMSVQLITGYQSSTATCQSVASVSGGTGPFIFTWSNGQNGDTVTGLTSGIFSVTVTDTNGCTAVQTDQCTVSAVSEIPELAYFRLYPNPAHGRVEILAAFNESQEAEIVLHNSCGTRLLSRAFEGTTLQMDINLDNFPGGLYFIELRSGSHVTVKQLTVF